MLALASRTAATKSNTVRGIDKAKMMPVACIPKLGCPEVSSKTEPTDAIAVMHEPARNKPLFGVNVYTVMIPPYEIGLTACCEKPFLDSSCDKAKEFSTRSTNTTPLR
jgi:hypothetical protein